MRRIALKSKLGFKKQIVILVIKLKRKFARWINKQFALLGVVIESEKPAEFIITTHAEERLKERTTLSRKDLIRHVIGAWFSTEYIPKEWINQKKGVERIATYTGMKKPRPYYRRYKDFIWVFAKHYHSNWDLPQKILITVYPNDINNI